MTFRNTPQSTATASLQGLMASMARYGVVFSPEGINAGEGDDTNKDDDAKKDDKGVARAGEREAVLQRQLDELNSRLQAFGGVTPDEVKELRDLKTKIEDERKAAEAARKKAEEDQLRAKGNFEELSRRMAEEHDRTLQEWKNRVAQLEGQVNQVNKVIVDLNVTSAFSGSRFVSEQTVLTPTKAQKIYGEYFEVENGRVVGYDAPAGAARRGPLVDARGNPLPFDEALKRIVEQDEDRDRVLKATTKPGANVVDSGVKANAGNKQASLSPLEKIRSGLDGLFPPKK